MTWAAWFDTAAGAASLGSLILGAILGLVSWRLSLSTNRHITRAAADTQALIVTTTANTQAILDRIDARAEERYRELKDRLDGRAS